MGTQQFLVPAKNVPTDGACKRFSINDTAERVARRQKLLFLHGGVTKVWSQVAGCEITSSRRDV